MDNLRMLDTAIIIALISGVFTIGGIIYNSRVQVNLKKREYEQKQIENMIKPYSKIVKFFYELLPKMNANVNTTENQKQQSQKQKNITKEIQALTSELNQLLILYGSNEVIKRWNVARKEAANPEKSLLEMENVLFAIREELGFKRDGTEDTELLALVINDVENIKG